MPAFPQYSTTTFLGNGQYFAPLPSRPVSSGVVPNPDPFVACLTGSMQICAHEFTGPGFRSCLYGMLTASNLLPTGVSSTSATDMINSDGGYSAGLELYCPYNSAHNW